MKDSKGPGLYLLEAIAIRAKNDAQGKPQYYWAGVAIAKSPSFQRAKEHFMKEHNLDHAAFAGSDPIVRLRKIWDMVRV